MDPNMTEQRKGKTGSILKTSTWGGLIAFPLVLLILGLTGHLSSPSGSTPVHRPVVSVASAKAPVSAETDKLHRALARVGGVLSAASKLSPFFKVSKEGKVSSDGAAVAEAPAPSVGMPVLSSSTSNSPKEEVAMKQALDLGAGSKGTADPQQIAAKIAPDLKGIDPASKVDVIVQFKRSTAPSDLAAYGATNKSDLPLVNGQLVTMTVNGNLSNLASHPGVAYVSPNRLLKGASTG